jgi:hypothetical protein
LAFKILLQALRSIDYKRLRTSLGKERRGLLSLVGISGILWWTTYRKTAALLVMLVIADIVLEFVLDLRVEMSGIRYSLAGLERGAHAVSCETREFILFLGSFTYKLDREDFSRTVTLENYPYRDTSVEVSLSESSQHVADLIFDVAKHLPVLRIGGREGKDPGVIIINVDDSDWFHVFEVLAADSRAIVVVPGTTGGLSDEAKEIKAKYATKLIILQPPETTIEEDWKGKLQRENAGNYTQEFWDRVDVGKEPHSTRPEVWSSISKVFSEELLTPLPPFKPGGQIICGSDSMTPSVYAYSLSGFLEAVSQIPNVGIPLLDSVLKLKNLSLTFSLFESERTLSHWELTRDLVYLP